MQKDTVLDFFRSELPDVLHIEARHGKHVILGKGSGAARMIGNIEDRKVTVVDVDFVETIERIVRLYENCHFDRLTFKFDPPKP